MSIQEILEAQKEYHCCIAELNSFDFTKLPEGAELQIECDKEVGDFFPVCILRKDKDKLRVAVTRWFDWDDNFFKEVIPNEFAEGVLQSCKKVISNVSYPITNPDYDLKHGEYLCVSWDIYLPLTISTSDLKQTILDNIDIVFNQAREILEGRENVLILGKDTGDSYMLLKEIEKVVAEMGYTPIIIKDKPDVVGEGVMQKALRYAMNSKFVIIEYTEPAGQLSELTTVVKSGESITAFLQEEGKGATWVNEDLFHNHTHVKRFKYIKTELKNKVLEVLKWAELQREGKIKYHKSSYHWLNGKGD